MGTIVLIALGLVIGALALGDNGWILGGGLGLAFGMIASLKHRILALELALKKQSKPKSTAEPEPPTVEPEQFPPSSAKPAVAMIAAAQVAELDQGLETAIAVDKTDSVPIQARTSSPKKDNIGSTSPVENNAVDKFFTMLKDFFTTGNVVVKVGAVVLFFGVAFLLKYAAENSLFPIEFRLMAVAAAGLAMLVLGWRLRTEKLEYGLILQGIGVGVLYLTSFAGSKFYHVLPVSFTLIIMLLLVVLAGVLAVRQDAKSLAIFGTIGGFLAPILMSTDSGNHIMLFSYYALLNVGVLGLAWFKSWRLLNLIGFVFTFMISAVWGYKAYQADYFSSTEPFLILFFLFYLLISILFALKQAPRLKGYVDGSLVFGLPLVAFALQSRLVAPFEYGGAISAAVIGILYLVLAKILWKPEKNGVRLLAESFLALGIVFVSLVIPLIFDGRWTAAMWSLEGAALVWVGLRQSQIISRGFGLLLAFGAAVAFLYDIYAPLPSSMPILNSAFIGMLLVSLAALLIAYLYDKNQAKLLIFEQELSMIILAWGLFWWFAAGLIEIERFVSTAYQLKVSLLFIALTTFSQLVLSYKLNWSRILLSSVLLTPVMLLVLIASAVITHSDSPLAYLGFLAWPIAFVVHLMLLCKHEQQWPKVLVKLWHAAGLAMGILLLGWVALSWVDGISGLSRLWSSCALAITAAVMAGSLMWQGERITWPVNQFKQAYYTWGLLPIMALLLIWQLVWFSKAGESRLFAYIPVLNPLDLTQIIVFVVMAYWLWFINKSKETQLLPMQPRLIFGAIAAMGFAWVNVVMARTIHFFVGVNYHFDALMASDSFQMATSIVWTLIAILFMMMSSKRASRLFWFAGAGLLALVVVKLFFVDLAGSGSVSRIVSFLVVGVLMLVVGYFSPLPPKTKQADILR